MDDDCGVSVFIVPDCSRFVSERGSLGSPKPVENGLDFAGCEGFSAFIVAHLLQLVPQHVVAAYHRHEVLDGGFGGAVGEVEEGEFFLGIGAEFCFHGVFFFNGEFCEFYEWGGSRLIGGELLENYAGWGRPTGSKSLENLVKNL